MSKANLYAMVNGLKTYVTTGLPAQLHLVELELADGVKLPDPKLHFLGWCDPFTATDYPMICYIAATPELDPVIMAEWLNPEIDIMVSLNHSKPETLEKILLRYYDALTNLIRVDRSIGGICDNSYFTGQALGHPGGDDKTHAILYLTLKMLKEIRT